MTESALYHRVAINPLTATARLRTVKVSFSVPTDSEGSKIAPLGCTKETVWSSGF